LKALFSSWRDIFAQIETTHVQRPAGNVVRIPHALDKLKDAILSVINERNLAEQELETIHGAAETLEKELTAALDKNTIRRRDAMMRLNRLQQEMAAVMADLEIRCDVPVPPQAVFANGQEDEK
jgi:predicted enzyme involved in methoxymalonyl-ACP biosynthesis